MVNMTMEETENYVFDLAIKRVKAVKARDFLQQLYRNKVGTPEIEELVVRIYGMKRRCNYESHEEWVNMDKNRVMEVRRILMIWITSLNRRICSYSQLLRKAKFNLGREGRRLNPSRWLQFKWALHNRMVKEWQAGRERAYKRVDWLANKYGDPSQDHRGRRRRYMKNLDEEGNNKVAEVIKEVTDHKFDKENKTTIKNFIVVDE